MVDEKLFWNLQGGVEYMSWHLCFDQLGPKLSSLRRSWTLFPSSCADQACVAVKRRTCSQMHSSLNLARICRDKDIHCDKAHAIIHLVV